MDDLAPAAGPSGRMQANSRRRGRPAIKPRLAREADQTDDEIRTLHLVRRSRRAAGGLTIGIATVSFVLSFTSLRELAAMAAWPGWPSWLWPLIIDGTIVLATLGIVSLAPYRDQFWNRVFLWGVLSSAALVSVGGNGLHAWLSTGHMVLWMRWGSAGLACVPPVALLATTHILAILWRFNPHAAARCHAHSCATVRSSWRRTGWTDGTRRRPRCTRMAIAGTCRRQRSRTLCGICTNAGPPMSLRAIGAQAGGRVAPRQCGQNPRRGADWCWAWCPPAVPHPAGDEDFARRVTRAMASVNRLGATVA